MTPNDAANKRDELIDQTKAELIKLINNMVDTSEIEQAIEGLIEQSWEAGYLQACDEFEESN